MKFSLTIFTILLPILGNSKEPSSDTSIPPIVNPGTSGNPDKVGKPPSDAIVLFDGSNFD